MSMHVLKLTDDEALVLFEYFARFVETDELRLEHPAEFIALGRLAGQLDQAMVGTAFSPKYAELLAGARSRMATGYEGGVPFSGKALGL